MSKIIAKLVYTLLFISWLLWPRGDYVWVMANQENQTMKNDQAFALEYIQVLEELAKKYGISMEEARQKAMLVHFDKPIFPPGSKVISESLHLLGGNSNSFVLNGVKWTGDSKEQAQLVVIQDGKILSSTRLGPHDAKHGTTIILFSPDRIDYFDWTTLRGGYFPR